MQEVSQMLEYLSIEFCFDYATILVSVETDMQWVIDFNFFALASA